MTFPMSHEDADRIQKQAAHTTLHSTEAQTCPPGFPERAARVATALCRHYRGAHVPEETYQAMRGRAADFIQALLTYAPISPERSTAVAKAREALMWGIAALVVNEPPSD